MALTHHPAANAAGDPGFGAGLPKYRRYAPYRSGVRLKRWATPPSLAKRGVFCSVSAQAESLCHRLISVHLRSSAAKGWHLPFEKRETVSLPRQLFLRGLDLFPKIIAQWLPSSSPARLPFAHLAAREPRPKTRELSLRTSADRFRMSKNGRRSEG